MDREQAIQAFKVRLAQLLEAEASCLACNRMRNFSPLHDTSQPICEIHAYLRRKLAVEDQEEL